jgi:hypothetical protein
MGALIGHGGAAAGAEVGLRRRISLVLAAIPGGCSLHADVGWINVGRASDLPQSVQLHVLMTSGRFGEEIRTWPQRQEGVSMVGLYQRCRWGDSGGARLDGWRLGRIDWISGGACSSRKVTDHPPKPDPTRRRRHIVANLKSHARQSAPHSNPVDAVRERPLRILPGRPRSGLMERF